MRPDVVLLDFERSDLDGIEAVPQLGAAHPSVKVLVSPRMTPMSVCWAPSAPEHAVTC